MLRIAALGELGEDQHGFGAKALHLARLKRHGLPVPDGFAIAGGAQGAPRIEPHQRSDILAAYAALAKRAGSPPDAPPAVAVRSSASGEDGAEFSFAGQYQTRLDVIGGDALLHAIHECLASRTGERAIAYRQAAGLAAGRMGVLVQLMVPAEYAGVCFTQSPTAPDDLVIELVEGLADDLASGSRHPARIALARAGLAVRSEDDPAGVLARFGRERAQEVARLSLAAEARLESPVDVEWACAAGTIHLVQARPITATARPAELACIRSQEIERLGRIASAARRTVVWTDSGIADMASRLSPLGFEILKLTAARGGSLDRSLRRLGLRYGGGSGDLYQSICGRTYLDLGEMLGCIDAALPLALDARAIGAVEGRALDIEQLPVRLAWRGWSAALRLPAAAVRWLSWVPLRFFQVRARFHREFRDSIEPSVTAEAARLRQADLTAVSNADLWPCFRAHLDRFLDVHTHHQLADNLTWPTHFLLRRNLRRLYGPELESVEMRLTTGLPGNFNTETNLDLARVARGDLPMQVFRDRYGHRGSPDYEISSPRWREDPERLAAMAKTIARSGTDPLRQFDAQVQIRLEAEARLARDLQGDRWLRPWQGAILRELDYYQRYSPLREATQALSWLFIELARRVLLEAARRTALGELIFFLSLAELEALLTEGPTPGYAASARARREHLLAARRIHVPHIVRSDDLEAIGRPPPGDAGVAELRGQPVSAGVARGRARVVRELDEAREIEAGEILVADAADPSWTPVFLLAGALVLEQGGLLSHPAIVAREHGIPALVNVPHATRRIRTGDRLTVDADRGRVLLEAAATPAGAAPEPDSRIGGPDRDPPYCA